MEVFLLLRLLRLWISGIDFLEGVGQGSGYLEILNNNGEKLASIRVQELVKADQDSSRMVQ